MVIDSINCYQLHIPFRTAFSHSSATRVKTESIWVEITSDNGLTGYGESCPRDYVTGETLSEAMAWIGKRINVLIGQYTAWMTSLVSNSRIELKLTGIRQPGVHWNSHYSI